MRKALLVAIALGALIVLIPSQANAHSKKSANHQSHHGYYSGGYSHNYHYSYPSYSYSYPSYSYGSYYNNHCYTYRESWRYVPGYYYNYCGYQYYQSGYWVRY